jgi:hypothetical protein
MFSAALLFRTLTNLFLDMRAHGIEIAVHLLSTLAATPLPKLINPSRMCSVPTDSWLMPDRFVSGSRSTWQARGVNLSAALGKLAFLQGAEGVSALRNSFNQFMETRVQSTAGAIICLSFSYPCTRRKPGWRMSSPGISWMRFERTAAIWSQPGRAAIS